MVPSMSSQALIWDSGEPNANDTSDLCSGCGDEITKKGNSNKFWHREHPFWTDFSLVHVALHILSILTISGLAVTLARSRMGRKASCIEQQSIYCL